MCLLLRKNGSLYKKIISNKILTLSRLVTHQGVIEYMTYIYKITVYVVMRELLRNIDEVSSLLILVSQQMLVDFLLLKSRFSKGFKS